MAPAVVPSTTRWSPELAIITYDRSRIENHLRTWKTGDIIIFTTTKHLQTFNCAPSCHREQEPPSLPSRHRTSAWRSIDALAETHDALPRSKFPSRKTQKQVPGESTFTFGNRKQRTMTRNISWSTCILIQSYVTQVESVVSP